MIVLLFMVPVVVVLTAVAVIRTHPLSWWRFAVYVWGILCALTNLAVDFFAEGYSRPLLTTVFLVVAVLALTMDVEARPRGRHRADDVTVEDDGTVTVNRDGTYLLVNGVPWDIDVFHPYGWLPAAATVERVVATQTDVVVAFQAGDKVSPRNLVRAGWWVQTDGDRLRATYQGGAITAILWY